MKTGYHCDSESDLVRLCLTCTAPRCHGNCERYAEAAKAASTGWRGGRKPPRRYTYQHKRRTLAEWARITGVSEPSLRSRLKRGLTIAQAIEMGKAKRGGSRGPQYTAEGFCHRNPDFIAAYCEYVKKLIADTAIDGISTDDSKHYMHFRSCACPVCRAALRERKSLNMQFGTLVSVFTLVPVLNLAIMPVAVCGATAMWVDCYRGKHASWR